MANSREFDIVRWRSFAERYLVERASMFEPGQELEGIWRETNNALSAYQHIYQVGLANDGKELPVLVVPPMSQAFEDATAVTSLPDDAKWYAKLGAKVLGLTR